MPTPKHDDIHSYLKLSKDEIDEKFLDRPVKEVFTQIYEDNFWREGESISGPGSGSDQTATLVPLLGNLIAKYSIKSMLDIPCGDFFWMKNINLKGAQYIGGDIVEAMISANSQAYSDEKTRFQVLDMLKDPLPAVDMVFCRDCWVHFSFSHVFNAIQHVKQSGSSYLLTTTFPERPENKDITTGNWRTLNLSVAPFHFPPPIALLNENCTEMGGNYTDKSLGLWRIADL